MEPFSFNSSSLREMLNLAISGLLFDVDGVPVESAAGDDKGTPGQLYKAMLQAIDVMDRADMSANIADEGGSPMTPASDEISRIGDHALEILEELSTQTENETGETNRDIQRLSIPVALWTARHAGVLSRLSLVVNAFSGYANELTEQAALEELSMVMGEVIDAVRDDVRNDLDQSNPYRPWRILNLNRGIVATRTHNPKIMESVFDSLVNYLPQDARHFFQEGMRQMDVVGFPQEVRAVMEKFDNNWGAGKTLH